MNNAKSEKDIKYVVEDSVRLINANGAQKIKKISIAPIRDFIFSVILHPKASTWQDTMMRTFCDKF